MLARSPARSLLAAAAALTAAAVLAAGAVADSTPVGRLPKGPVTTVVTPRGSLVAVALPHRRNGNVWRLARRVDPRVLRQVSEADVGPNVVVVFRATGSGVARVVYALTRGDVSGKALESVTHVVRVKS
jgi:hypothetical protein